MAITERGKRISCITHASSVAPEGGRKHFMPSAPCLSIALKAAGSLAFAGTNPPQNPTSTVAFPYRIQGRHINLSLETEIRNPTSKMALPTESPADEHASTDVGARISSSKTKQTRNGLPLQYTPKHCSHSCAGEWFLNPRPYSSDQSRAGLPSGKDGSIHCSAGY